MNWEAVGQFMIDNIGYLYQNYSLYQVILMVVIMGLIISLVALLKKPIKRATNKIPNKTVRTLANKSIIILAFLVSAGLWWGFSKILPQFVIFDWTQIVLSFTLSITGYAFGDGLIPKKKAVEITDSVKAVTKDGKIDEKDKEIVKDFLDNINKGN
jgi:uncharacterized membrane protein YbjE (DUF340 family)